MMPPSKNSYVTLWHAANAGDIDYLRRRIGEAFKEDAVNSVRERYFLDLKSLEYRLLRCVFPNGLQDEAPKLPGFEEKPLLVLETKSLRLVIETLAGRSIAGHGYLTDLSLEREFGNLVLENYGDPTVSKPAGNVIANLFGKDRTLTYACTSELRNEMFVGIIAFSDFATFTLEGYLLGGEGQKPLDVLKDAMLKILKAIEPS